MDRAGIALEGLAAVVGSVVVAVATVGGTSDPLLRDAVRVLRYSTGMRLICAPSPSGATPSRSSVGSAGDPT